MLKAIGLSAVISLAMMTLIAARPQETVTEDLADVIQEDALSNADGEHLLFSGIGTGPQYGEEAAKYEGQGTDETTTVTDVLEPSTETNASPTANFSQENQEAFNLLLSTQQASPLFQNIVASPSLPIEDAPPFFPEEVSPLSPPYVASASPSIPKQEASQPLHPAYGTSPLFASATPTFERDQTLLSGNQANSPNSLIGSRKSIEAGKVPIVPDMWHMLNHSQRGNATAGGAGRGSVQNNSAIADGTGIANVGFGGFGIGLGIGGAIQTSLGNLAFGQGNGIAIG